MSHSTPNTHSEAVNTTSTESIHVDDNQSVVSKQNSSSYVTDNE